jgi:hypothetical protein
VEAGRRARTRIRDKTRDKARFMGSPLLIQGRIYVRPFQGDTVFTIAQSGGNVHLLKMEKISE